MRGIVPAAVAIQTRLALPAYAENPPDSDRSISEALPPFEKNRCEVIRDPAEQLFCGDPELNGAAEKLASRSRRTRNGSEIAIRAAGFSEDKTFRTGNQIRQGLPVEGDWGTSNNDDFVVGDPAAVA